MVYAFQYFFMNSIDESIIFKCYLPFKLHFSSSVRPTSKNHLTNLLVEGKVLDINGTRRLIDGARDPHYSSIGVHKNFAWK